MKMVRTAINIPGNGEYEGAWRINYPFTKLALKYGYLGTWNPNWSLAFDQYAATRAPKKGLPNLVDFSTTMLMNSRVRTTDVKTLGSWLAVPENVDRLERVRDALAVAGGLADLPRKSVVLLGNLLDDMIWGRELQGVRMAKIAKWLSAWAPGHVPMIDKHVYRAMTGNKPLGNVPMADVLARFQKLLVTNHEQLSQLGELLASRLGEPEGTISPVRVLDSLVWFDWWAIYQYASDFKRWLAPNNTQGAREHLIREEGVGYAQSQGIE
jgi:hypothetical protein